MSNSQHLRYFDDQPAIRRTRLTQFAQEFALDSVRRSQVRIPVRHNAARQQHTPEQLEARLMFSADPIEFGSVYTEQDTGSDHSPDTIEVSFEGGAPGTKLSKIEIDGDKVFPGLGAGFGFGDMIFDTEQGGYGVDLPFFQAVVEKTGEFDVQITVADGSSLLEIAFDGFDAGEKLTLSIDVDEVQSFDPDESDFDQINDDLDPIASGAEFQGSQFTAYFSAPHFEDVQGTAEFRDRYDERFGATELDLPLDDENGNRARTAGAIGELSQVPQPIWIAGSVYEDDNVNLQLDPGEQGIANVELSLFVLENEQYVYTGQTAVTDDNGDYLFDRNLGLMPGVYEVRETQPDGYFSVGAEVGTVQGETSGRVLNDDVLTGIAIPLGGTHAADYNFAEARPASLRGSVHLSTPDGDCWSDDVQHAPVPDATIQLFDAANQLVAETRTDAMGNYEFLNLYPGEYAIVELTPPTLFAGGAQAGTIAGIQRGVAGESNITQIQLTSGDEGVEYEFCDLPPADLRGNVYHDRNQNGLRDEAELGIEGVPLALLDETGETVDTTESGADGTYQFLGLRAGDYRIVETQPEGWLDGLDRAGTANGRPTGQAQNPGDEIEAIALLWGDQGIDFNFGEILPASIQGRVHLSTPDGDCWNEDIEHAPVVGARVELYDANNDLVAHTLTDAQGRYAFSDLPPGQYTLVEITPDGLLPGGSKAGSVEGAPRGLSGQSSITEIELGSGQNGIEYLFCDLSPAELRGKVYHDRNQSGSPDQGEEGISQVALNLVNELGDVVDRAITNADGEYAFLGLEAGNYRVIETQPDGWLDGEDRAGTANGRSTGQARNPGDEIEAINLLWGDRGIDFDFAELLSTSISGRVHLSTTDGDCWNIDESLLQPIAGAVVQLFDTTGRLLAETQTNASGNYLFSNLAPGEYSLREITPAHLIDAGANPGNVLGETRGQVNAQGDIERIVLLSGEAGLSYDFCEYAPASISGFVFEDANNDAQREATERPIAGVTVQLYDSQDQLVAETVTDGNGQYAFERLVRDRYTIRQKQPAAYLDGTDSPGTVEGSTRGTAINPGDEIQSIQVGWGETGIEYNFAELLAASIHGIVHAGTSDDCWNDETSEPLADVTIRLLDDAGQTVSETRTDAAGRYSFEGLAPGSYQVIQVQPSTHFSGSHRAGTAGGDDTEPNLVADIELLPGFLAEDYDFCELVPSGLSGFVFVDGEPIELAHDETLPVDISPLRDGQRDPGDQPLPGVTLELRNGVTGLPIDASVALPGAYPDGPIQTVTDSMGYYEFLHLPRGNYAVYEIQPDGLVDGIDSPGTSSGVAINPLPPDEDDIILETLISSLLHPHQNDAIIRIGLFAGDHAAQNNFSEVLVQPLDPPTDPPRFPPLPPFPPGPPPAPPVGPAPVDLYRFVRELPPPVFLDNPIPIDGSDSTEPRTWHLSIVDGGQPRVSQDTEITKHLFPTAIWHRHHLAHARWEVGGEINAPDIHYFGTEDAIPVTGDFDGDGVSEIGVYVDGHWFIDLNGNGSWDSTDLWAKLGTEGDLPVTGDWDGDGKDDIGIFGRAWVGDMTAVAYEPGLPDMDNVPDGNRKNMPPELDEATAGQRFMKLTARGKLRADLIDHVFLYGTAGDMAISGDWNGDGIDNVGVYRAGIWRLDMDGNGRWTERDGQIRFGRKGDMPLVGDFNGDGIDDLAIVRGGKIYWDMNGNRRIDANELIMEFDADKGLPVVGKWSIEGTDSIGFFRPTRGNPVTVAARPDKG